VAGERRSPRAAGGHPRRETSSGDRANWLGYLGSEQTVARRATHASARNRDAVAIDHEFEATDGETSR
jgi:hypothetical protein